MNKLLSAVSQIEDKDLQEFLSEELSRVVADYAATIHKLHSVSTRGAEYRNNITTLDNLRRRQHDVLLSTLALIKRAGVDINDILGIDITDRKAVTEWVAAIFM